MFGGLTDLNQQFAQFTSALSLDSMQKNQEEGDSATKADPAGNAFNSQVSQEHDKDGVLSDHSANIIAMTYQEQNDNDKNQATEPSVGEKDETVSIKHQYESEIAALRSELETLRLKNTALIESKSESSSTEIVEQIESVQTELIESRKAYDEIEKESAAEKMKFMVNSREMNEKLLKSEKQSRDYADELNRCKISLAAAEQQCSELKLSISMTEMRNTELHGNLREQIENRDANIARLKEQCANYFSSISALQTDNSSVRNELTKSQEKCRGYENEVSVKTAALNNSQSEASTAVEQHASLVEELATKDTKISELQGKLQVLTEKTREVMQKYVEAKSQGETGQEESTHRISEISKQLQEKESEVLSLRMKTENLDRSLSDARLKSQEVTEKNAEALKELALLSEKLSQAQGEVEVLSTGLNEAKGINLAIAEENKELKIQIETLRERNAAAVVKKGEEYSAALSSVENKWKEAQDRILELQAELATATARTRAEADVAAELADYKKRAQIAIKKANNSASSATTEMERMKISIAEHSRRMEALEEEKLALLQEQRDLRGELSKTAGEIQQLTEQHQLLNQEYEGKLIEAVRSAVVAAPLNSVHSVLKEADATEHSSPNNSTAHLVPLSAEENESETSAHQYYEESDSNVSWVRLAARSTDAPKIPGAIETVESELETGLVAGSNVSVAVSKNGEAEGTPVDAVEEALSTLDETVDHRYGDGVLLVAELHAQMQSLKKELSQRGIDVAAAHEELQYEKEEKLKLQSRIDELLAFLERTKHLHDGPDSAINMEYLKNCIVKFMSSTSASEKKRLYPVICTVLKVTSTEVAEIERAIDKIDREENELKNTISSIGTFANNSLAGFSWFNGHHGRDSGSTAEDHHEDIPNTFS